MDTREAQMNKAIMREIKQKRAEIREMDAKEKKPKSETDSINERESYKWAKIKDIHIFWYH